MQAKNKRKKPYRDDKAAPRVSAELSETGAYKRYVPLDEEQYPIWIYNEDNEKYMRYYVRPRAIMYIIYYINTNEIKGGVVMWQNAEGHQVKRITNMPTGLCLDNLELLTVSYDNNIKLRLLSK
jgi:hypothetical protein